VCFLLCGCDMYNYCGNRTDTGLCEPLWSIRLNCQSGTAEQGWMTEHLPLPFERGSIGVHVPLYNSIISNFMIYQDRLETNLLQLFAHTKFRMCFSVISVTVSKVNIVAEHVNAKRMTIIVLFYTELKQTTFNSWYSRLR